jgi:hypothetical protein
MKSIISFRAGVAALAIVSVLTLASCQKKTDESVGGDTSGSANAPSSNTSTNTSPGSSSSTTSTTASSGAKEGVAPQGTACPAGNPIKGLTSKKLGGKIYVTTKSPDYNKLKAEKCFTNEAAAKQAGYAAPK